jgi:hypothetical protein
LIDLCFYALDKFVVYFCFCFLPEGDGDVACPVSA